jgi:sarcosine oxidase subunit delta
MKIMDCPLNGPRNISEFAFGGEVQPMPKLNADARVWARYVFIENNTLGVVREWWIHVPTSYWFIAERNTQTNEIVRTYPSDELYKTRVEFTEHE